MTQRGSWTGETHLQKASYLLAELRDVDFDFDFILYKHGPFSFELRDELAAMRTEGLIKTEIRDPRYGARIQVTRRGEELEQRFDKTMRRYGDGLDWIADTVGSRGVMDLERLATALWMTRQDPKGTVRMRTDALVRVKPHISVEAAIESIEEIDQLLASRAIAVAG
jgi:uncharacterized protein YwgA